MPEYIVLRAHRGRYGYVRLGQKLTLPVRYGADLMRHRNPLVREATAEEAKGQPKTAAEAAPGLEGGAPGETKAGPTSADQPAAGSGRPLSSRQLARRSRKKT